MCLLCLLCLLLLTFLALASPTLHTLPWRPQVIAGATNGTAYVVNACEEGFYYTGTRSVGKAQDNST